MECDKRRGVRLGDKWRGLSQGLGGLDLVLRKMPNFQQLRDWGLGVGTKRNRKSGGDLVLSIVFIGTAMSSTWLQ